MQAADIVLHVLTPCAGTGGRNGIGCLHQNRNDGLGLHVAVVGFDGVDDDGIFLVLPGKIGAQLYMAAFHLVVNGLAQVMEQAGTLCHGDVHAKLRGHQTGDMGNLNGVVQNVLTVRGTVLLASQNLDQFGVQVVNAGLIAGALALFADGAVNFLARLFHHVLNAGGMNAAVHNELLQCKPGNLPTDGIKAGNGDGFRGIVDDQIDAGNGLQCADVPAFPADDAALHLIVGQRDHGDGGLGGVISGTALNRGGDDLAALFLGLVLQLRLDLLDLHGGFVTNLVLNAVKQKFLCLILCQTGNLFQLRQLLLLELVGLCLRLGDLLEPLGKLLFLAFKGFGLLVQSGFLLFQTALLLA